MEGDDWKPKVQAMNSAYKEAKGVEPEFTNWSKVKEDVRNDALYIFHEIAPNATDIFFSSSYSFIFFTASFLL